MLKPPASIVLTSKASSP